MDALELSLYAGEERKEEKGKPLFLEIQCLQQ